MECIELDNKIKITDVHDLDLAQTLDCGQSFRWKSQDDGSFHGVAYGKSVTVSLDKTDMYIENATADDFKNIWYSYFDFSLDYGKIREEISTIHPVLNEAAKYAPGIRILRQEPFEALCTFIMLSVCARTSAHRLVTENLHSRQPKHLQNFRPMTLHR